MLVAVVLGLGCASSMVAAETWVTGPALQQRMAERMDLVWADIPLRQALESLSRAQKVAILLDRRVDPGRKINLTINGMPLESVLQSIAEQCGLEIFQLGAVVYLGPPDAISRLRSLVVFQEINVRHLQPAAAHKFQQTKAMMWDELAEPLALLADLGRENSLKIKDLDRTPHDLWPAMELPPMSLVDRLTLITNQFDLTFKITSDGRGISLIPLPDNLENYKRISALRSPPKQPAKQESRHSTKQPSKPPVQESSADIGPIRIERMMVQEKPIGEVLRQLAKRLELDLQIDDQAIEDANISLTQRVSVTVENVTIDELLSELLKSTGLAFHRTEKTVEIFPAK